MKSCVATRFAFCEAAISSTIEISGIWWFMFGAVSGSLCEQFQCHIQQNTNKIVNLQ